jgi:hypothetical protein
VASVLQVETGRARTVVASDTRRTLSAWSGVTGHEGLRHWRDLLCAVSCFVFRG